MVCTGRIDQSIVDPQNPKTGQSLTILDMELYGWTIWRFTQPGIEVFSFPGLEKQDVVAVVQLGELIELIQLALCVKFRLLSSVRKESCEVIEEVSVSEGHASRCEHENSLSSLFGYRRFRCVARVFFGRTL
jgi:hypothetical protein